MQQLQLFATPQETNTSDDYWTPKWIFDAIGLTFDLDVACPPEGPAHTPCHAYYTQADNGLTSPWHGTVWMNPPFSSANNWVYKWLDHGDGIALVPFSKSRWFERLWKEAHALILPPIRTEFVQGQIFMAVVLASMGDTATTALTNSNLGHRR
jgi:phage N-6-adenine-methyltransferase